MLYTTNNTSIIVKCEKFVLIDTTYRGREGFT